MNVTKVNLYTDISGNKIGALKYEFGKGESLLYLQGGVHGGETTFFIFQELFEFFKKNESKLRGKVTLIPIVNPVAWNQRIYYYTVGKFDLYKGKDWNRSYPSTAKKTMSAQNSKVFFNIAKNYQLSLDFHTARISKPYTVFFNKNALDIIRTFGLPYNYLVPKSPEFSRSFDNALEKAGKLSFTVECGSHDSYNQKNINEVVDAIKRLVASRKILSIKTKKTSSSPV